MHSNQQLLKNLFDHLNASEHKEMAECYRNNATFHDIAFDLVGMAQIHAKWRMFCSPDKRGRCTGIRVEVETLKADHSTGRAVIVDDKDRQYEPVGAVFGLVSVKIPLNVAR